MSSSSIEPTIINFMDAVGEQTSNMSRRNIEQCTNRNVLRLSAKWADTVSKQRRHSWHGEKLDIDIDFDFDEELDEIVSTLTPECALLEVDAICILSSLDASTKRSNTSSDSSCRDVYDSDSDDEEDDASTELRCLEDSTRILQEELESVTRCYPPLQIDVQSEQSVKCTRDETLSNEEDRWYTRCSNSLGDLGHFGRSAISMPRLVQVSCQ
mmetsp:Transcript_34237/g.45357  ORF Transcript_34237/g.45357 Transcript_34237/m.45357 type:complete len:212 (+) Transcript_34237:376-1011(+)